LAGFAAGFFSEAVAAGLPGFLASIVPLTLPAEVFTSTSATLAFLAAAAGVGLAVATFVLLAGMTIPRKKAHRNDEMRGRLGKSIGVVWSGKL
jgi:hypothetical protein